MGVQKVDRFEMDLVCTAVSIGLLGKRPISKSSLRPNGQD